jgi:hypothetical protein
VIRQAPALLGFAYPNQELTEAPAARWIITDREAKKATP